MAFSNEELGEIDSIISEWCLNKVPVQLKSKIDYDYEIDGQAVSIFEVRPDFKNRYSLSINFVVVVNLAFKLDRYFIQTPFTDDAINFA